MIDAAAASQGYRWRPEVTVGWREQRAPACIKRPDATCPEANNQSRSGLCESPTALLVISPVYALSVLLVLRYLLSSPCQHTGASVWPYG